MLAGSRGVTVRFDGPAEATVTVVEGGEVVAERLAVAGDSGSEVRIVGLTPDTEHQVRVMADGAPIGASPFRTLPDLNVVIVMTDDQRADTLWSIPETMDRLPDRAVVFDRAYVSTPLCCPVRASFLAGGYLPVHTNIRWNQEPMGGFAMFNAEDTLGARLQRNGYRTALIGKVMNGYQVSGGTVPPGWDVFRGQVDAGDWQSSVFIAGSSREETVTGVEIRTDAYLTDYIRDEALAFMEAGPEPFFAYLAPYAPHDPAIPDTEDIGTVTELPEDAPSVDEADVSDKPAFVQALPLLDPETRAALDTLERDGLETMASVDRAMVALIDALDAAGRLDRTLIVFASDNGYLYGEHRLQGKGLPYEESIRVPMVVWAPEAVPRTEDRLVVMDLDVPATVGAWTGVLGEGDGMSLWPLLRDEEADQWREGVLIEGYPLYGGWAALVRPDFKLVSYLAGDLELYDRVADPYELESLHADPALAALRDEMLAELDARRGVVFPIHQIPTDLGVEFDVQLQPIGGTAPYTWSATNLPDGVELSEDGRLWGRADDRTSATLVVTDSSTAHHAGGPQRYADLVLFGR